MIENLTINSGTNPAAEGIKLENVTNGQLINVTVKNGYYGISLEAATNLVLIDNYAVNNTQDGFSLSLDSNNNILINNTATINRGNGFHVANGSSNTFSGNSADLIAKISF
jgi:parallel beta-helix repeat protein